MMNSLERARAHLLQRQRWLAIRRQSEANHPGMFHHSEITAHENAVLAALSWVWAEQEKRRVSDYREALAHVRLQVVRARDAEGCG